MPLNIETLIERKNQWMASHVTDAEYPTPQSLQGLEIYNKYQSQLITSPIEACSDFESNLLSFYPVDCHPLTIRYSIVQAGHWEDDEAREMAIEFLTQIMLEENSPAQLYVGFYKGKPAACGMIYSEDDDIALITDVNAINIEIHQQLKDEMVNYLVSQASHRHTDLYLQQ
ncbi:hypothetical protein [Photobacterium damselae]|uniref:Flavodoxin n=1 Tax=Photobacterium damselae subsp. damselae TaxID=85581 RepID=A0A850R285_PHODD|nr:hypothetical protein [Photobacterium damselae]EHA1081469.1 hypothetical protein [Photobacterium damselae]MBA5682333.1 hypothetical protein [Photobacterium damselae subsp. damselae]NVH52673.1 hypothetical protein [Photobacterium damselae subsp. damselae]NVO82897.1 hypothetical protein [Photobacterium damselae subsp. damselae]NVP01629.1 hypothetical protein [Photobacterium damselae subsp. damselae]